MNIILHMAAFYVGIVLFIFVVEVLEFKKEDYKIIFISIITAVIAGLILKLIIG